MTTTITLHVNGRYKASVKQDDLAWVEVHGNYAGSPNPDGKAIFNLRHATSNKFVVNEEHIPEPKDAVAQGGVIEVGTTSKAIDGNAPGMTDDLKADFKD